MTIASELSRILNGKADVIVSVAGKGQTIPGGTLIDAFPPYIDAISTGSPTVPDAFVSGNWTAATGSSPGEITVNITALPANGGSAITALQYRLNGGSAVNFTGTGTGSRTISGLTPSTSYNIEIRAVNSVGNAAWSDTKSATSAASGGGSGTVTWVAVGAPTHGTLTGGGTTPPRPAGVVSTDLLVLTITNINSAVRAAMTIPTGWTFRGEVYTDFGGGLGIAVYTASASVADAAWTSSAGSTVSFDMHGFRGANLSAPVRAIQTLTSVGWPNYEDNDMPSPSATASAGDGVLSYYFQPQDTDAVGTPTSGYTRRVNTDVPNRRSALTRDNVSAGATGPISHGASSAYEARAALTLVIAAE